MQFHCLALPIVFIAVGVAAPRAVRAQETASDSLLTVDHYLDWEQVADPQLSPDGAQIVYTRRYVNKIEDKWESALWIMHADGTKNRFLVKGAGARWSPDGTRILYTADGDPKGTQLFVRWMDAEGATSQITHVTETRRRGASACRRRPKAPSGPPRRASWTGCTTARTGSASPTKGSPISSW